MAPRKTIYLPTKDYELPDIDILTLIYDSPEAHTQESTILHAEAACPSNSITKSQARAYTKRLAWVFRHVFSIGARTPGKDVVVCISSGQILLSNVFYGVMAAGGVFSAASSAFTPAELARQVRQGKANVIVCSEDCRDVAVKAARECGVPLERVLVLESMVGASGGENKRVLRDVQAKGTNWLGDSEEEWARKGQMLEWERITDPKVLRERVVCLLYSSGTTGVPKGVNISHQNLVSEGLIPQYQIREHLAARRLTDPNWTFEYRTLAHLPAAHIAGCQGYFVNPALAGGPVYWMPKFSFPEFLQYNRQFRITYFFTVPPIYLLIAKSPLVTDQFKTLVHAVAGAAPMGAELQAQAEKKLGCQISQTWGLSETTGSVTAMPWAEKDDTGSVSPLLPNMRLRIVDDDEHDVPDGAEGEFILQGPVVTTGYWDNAAATRDAFTRDGAWFKTGDVGVCKNGKFYVVDRKKELIKYKGLQVAPAELEALLLSHPRILDAAVIGVPDPSGSGNELPRAYVVVGGGGGGGGGTAKISAEEIKAFVKQNLAAHKQLRGGVVYVDAIPKSASGKILRRELREAARRTRGAEGAKI